MTKKEEVIEVVEDNKDYIWDKQVKSIKWTEVVFEDWTVEVLTETQLKYIVTKWPRDLSQIRNIVLKEIVLWMLNLLEDHNVRRADLKPILETLWTSYDESFNIAIGKAFGTYKEGEHSQNGLDNIRVSDIKRLKDM